MTDRKMIWEQPERADVPDRLSEDEVCVNDRSLEELLH